MQLIECTEAYASQILDIYNHAIEYTTALYDYQPWTMETMKTWFAYKREHNYPVIGIVNSDCILMGFGSYGQFRVRPAYKYTIENSLYVHHNFRGQGLGKILLQQIIEHATRQQYHCIIAVIDAQNDVSVGLHQAYGFENVGTFKQVGYKFGQWLDATFMQLTLSTPQNPTEG